MSGIVTYVPNQYEWAECYEGGVEVREGNRWSSRKHRLYKSRYWQVVSITIAPATALYANSNDLCTDMRLMFARISNVARLKLAKVFIFFGVSPDYRCMSRKVYKIEIKVYIINAFQSKRYHLKRQTIQFISWAYLEIFYLILNNKWLNEIS